MKKVIEVAKLLGVSKVTIYKKMEIFKKDLKPHIHTIKKITYLDEEGIEIIKKSLIENNVIQDENESNEIIVELLEKVKKSDLKVNEVAKDNKRILLDSIEENERFIDISEKQLKSKKNQLDSLDKSLESLKNINGANKNRIKYLEVITKDI